MGLYRDITNLRGFVRRLRLKHGLDLQPAHPTAQADIPEPSGADLVAPVPGVRRIVGQVTKDGRPILEWQALLDAARHAVKSGLQPSPIDGYTGLYIGIELGGAIELVAFDRAFEVAKLRDDAVLIDGGRLCIRVEGSPAMN